MPGKTDKLKELSEIFHGIESTKGKMLEATPNSERNVTTCHNIEKKLTLYCKLHDEKTGSTVQRTFCRFFIRKYNALILKVSNVLNYCVRNGY